MQRHNYDDEKWMKILKQSIKDVKEELEECHNGWGRVDRQMD